MLNTIKSKFFMKNIFLLLDEKKLLKLVAYNKELQNLMDIKLICYKVVSGKYFLGDKNGYGKEFNRSNNKLIYEGEYLNGKRNGKGKEYDKDGNLIFEGEYLNGKRNGKGKEIMYCLFNREYIFQGEYLNGKRWNGYEYFNGNDKKECEIKNGEGTVIEYYRYSYCDDIMIKCEYKNGEKIKGIEKIFFSRDHEGAHIEFEGEYLNGKRWNGIFQNYYENYELKNGKGFALEINDDNYYEGELINGEKNGKGKEYYYWKRILFEGEYLNGKRNGKGKEYYKNGNLRFEGEYKYGLKSKGNEYYNNYNNDKLYFKGEYKSGIKWNGEGYDENGKIIIKINNGKGFIKEYYNGNNYYRYRDFDYYLIFEGEYLNGEKHGKGIEYNKNGKPIFEGEYYKGERWNGKGKEYDKYDNAIFEGEYLNGKMSGKEYNKEGKILFEGEYIAYENFRHRWNGKGKEYDKEGKLIFEGEYKKGKRWNGKVKGISFKGEYKEGKRWNGKGEEYDSDDNLIFKGEYKGGKRWNGKGEEYDYGDYLIGIEYEEGGRKEYMEEKIEKNIQYLIKGSKQKTKRIQLNEKYEEF